jgi:type I restriction enzyme R subunit
MDVEGFFEKLLAFAKELDQEEQRGVAEQLNDEELAVFDILTKPEFELSDEDRKQVKSVARALLQTLKEAKLVLDWRKKLRTRADVFSTVKTVLDDSPRIYSVELYQQKCGAVYRHLYDSYQGEGVSVYQMA